MSKSASFRKAVELAVMKKSNYDEKGKLIRFETKEIEESNTHILGEDSKYSIPNLIIVKQK